MFGWLGAIVARVFGRPRSVVAVVQSAEEVIDAVRDAGEPSQPLTYKDVGHIRAQERAAIEASKKTPKEPLSIPVVFEPVPPRRGPPRPPKKGRR